MLIVPDTLATPQQDAVRELYREAGAMSTALFNYAVSFIQERGDLTPDFTVGPQEMDALFRYLTDEAGLSFDRATFDRASPYLERQFEAQVAQQAFEDRGRFERMLPYDDVVNQAAQALLVAETVEDAVFAPQRER